MAKSLGTKYLTAVHKHLATLCTISGEHSTKLQKQIKTNNVNFISKEVTIHYTVH